MKGHENALKCLKKFLSQISIIYINRYKYFMAKKDQNLNK